MLELANLRVGYRGREVLCGASLRVGEGEVAALLGMNGSGKSTLIRAVLGLIPVRGGRATLAGENLLTLSARRRAQLCAYVPQDVRVEDGATALEIVLMGANARTPLLAPYSAAQRAQASQCLAQLGVQGLSARRMGELSQGQRQLVLFARALMQQPRAFLLDEPDSALDLPHRHAMMRRVRSLAADGRVALVALHDASLALNVCDRVFTFRDGVIAGELDMRDARDEEIEREMRALYGDVALLRGAAGAALIVPAGAL